MAAQDLALVGDGKVAAGPGGEIVEITRANLTKLLEAATDRATKAARSAATREKAAAVAVLETAHTGELTRLQGELVHRQAEAHAHGFHKAGWMFGLGGVLAGALIVLVLVVSLQGAISSSATQAASQGILMGQVNSSLQGAVHPSVLCVPGEDHNSDGQPCPHVHAPGAP